MNQHEHSAEKDACMPAWIGVLTLKISRIARGSTASRCQNPGRIAGILNESALPQDPGRLERPLCPLIPQSRETLGS